MIRMDFEEAKNKVNSLTQELKYHNDRYYNNDDWAYDIMNCAKPI